MRIYTCGKSYNISMDVSRNIFELCFLQYIYPYYYEDRGIRLIRKEN